MLIGVDHFESHKLSNVYSHSYGSKSTFVTSITAMIVFI